MIPFIQKAWFLWWILATLLILRWFRLFASRTDDEGAFETADSAKGKPSKGSNRFRREPQAVYLPESRETQTQ